MSCTCDGLEVIEVSEDPVCFRAAVRVLEAIVAIRGRASTVSVRLDGLEQV